MTAFRSVFSPAGSRMTLKRLEAVIGDRGRVRGSSSAAVRCPSSGVSQGPRSPVRVGGPRRLRTRKPKGENAHLSRHRPQSQDISPPDDGFTVGRERAGDSSSPAGPDRRTPVFCGCLPRWEAADPSSWLAGPVVGDGDRRCTAFKGDPCDVQWRVGVRGGSGDS